MRQKWQILAAVLAVLLPMSSLPARAQDRAVLIADSLRLTNSDVLVAENNVEITYNGNRLNARRVIYDQGLNRLIIEGPFTLDTGDDVMVLADAADLSADMKEGIIKSARIVMGQRLQITAAQVQRIDGKYKVMQRVAASTCQICADDLKPLWEVRARSVTHDEAAQQLYFENAQFWMMGLPLAYVPRLRLPDPGLKRANGFLTPRVTVNTAVGVGLKLPYFITLGRHADVTITPFVSDQNSRSLNLAYRQAFEKGEIAVSGTYTRDEVIHNNARFYGLATGAFDLPRGYKLTLRAETVSDAAYFQSYGLTEQDRLVTFGQVQRSRHDVTVNGRLLGTQSIRATEDNATQPSLIADADWQQRYDLGALGEASLSLQAHARQRGSIDPLDGSDPDNNADGRDVIGFGLRANWQKMAVFGPGVLGTLQSELRSDSYRVAQDAIYQGDYNRLHAAFGAELRWPLVQSRRDGTLQTLEPIAQMVVTPQSSNALFNEDSSLVQFDEGNLFALNRFPGSETVEEGTRLNLGINYGQQTAAGQAMRISFGRVFRAKDLQQFSQASGLDGTTSDWLAATRIDFGTAFNLTGRVLFDDALALTKTEIRAMVKGAGNVTSAGLLFAPADADEERADKISELTLSTRQNLSQFWTATMATRYDFVSNNTAKGAFGLVYRNECLLVDVSLSRSFTSSTNVSPSTDFGLSVELLGFGGSDAGVAAECRQ